MFELRSFKYTMRRNLLNWCNLVSISKTLMFFSGKWINCFFSSPPFLCCFLADNLLTHCSTINIQSPTHLLLSIWNEVYTMRRNWLNWCNLVSISEKLMFYVSGKCIDCFFSSPPFLCCFLADNLLTHCSTINVQSPTHLLLSI